MDRCRKPRDVAAITRRKLEEYNKKRPHGAHENVRRVLYELATQLPPDDGCEPAEHPHDKDTSEHDAHDSSAEFEEFYTGVALRAGKIRER